MTVTATAPAAPKRRIATPKPASKPAPKPANPVLTPEQEAELKLALRLAELKEAYRAARTGEAKHKGILKEAKLQWENSRVITSRIAYAVAMLKPYEGAANLSFAARELHMEDEDLALTGEALKRKTKSAKSSIRNYVNAGAALFEAGQDPENRTSKPDEVERKIVADAFKAGNARNTTTNPGAGTTEESAADKDEDGATATLPDALTVTDLLEHVSRLQATLALMVKSSVPVSENEAANVAATLEDFLADLSAYAAS